MSSRIKGIIDAVSEIAMDYSARMERAKEQGFDWADGRSRDGIDYVNKAMRDGDPQAQAFSQYLSDNNIPYKPHVARTGSTYIDVLGDPYKLRDGGYSQSPLQYRFADHSKGKFGRDSYLGANHIDSTMEADVFPGGNTLEQAIAKLEDTPGVRSRDAAFDAARRFDKNYLASGAGLGVLGAGLAQSEDADASLRSLAQRGINLVDIVDPEDSRVGEYYLQKGSDPKSIGSVKTDYALDSGFGDGYMASLDTEIAPEYRRQGLAREMYDAIEEVSGNKLVPSNHLSPDGAAMWNARNRDLLEQVQKKMDGDAYDTVEQVLRPDGVTQPLELRGFSRNFGLTGVGAGLLGALQVEDAEAGPLTAGRRLIDPSFSVALGGGKPRVGLIDAIEQMPAGITPRSMDKGGEYDLYDFEGSPYILTQSDRSSAGGLLESLYGRDIDPVDLRGGRDFMFDKPSEGMVWASDPKVTRGLFERAQRLEKDYGKAPLLLPYTMAPTGIDFATMPLDTMINFARSSMAKKDIKALDEDIRGIIPDWKGVADPTSNEIFRTVGGDPRKAVADLIDKKYRSVEGGLSIAEARAATTDASQYTGEMGDLANIGVFDTKRGLIADSGHPTYIGGIPGEGVGTLRDTINARELALDKGRTMKGDSSDIRALSMNHELQQGVIDESLLRRLYDNKGKAVVAGSGVAGPSLANASSGRSDADGAGLLGAIGDVALESMSGVNRAVADGINFLTSDQVNAILNLSGSDKRIPDLYDIPGVESGTKGNYMEPGLLRQIVRQGSEFLSPI